MGFFQDLKQDLSQAVNELVEEADVKELPIEEEEQTLDDELANQTSNEFDTDATIVNEELSTEEEISIEEVDSINEGMQESFEAVEVTEVMEDEADDVDVEDELEELMEDEMVAAEAVEEQESTLEEVLKGFNFASDIEQAMLVTETGYMGEGKMEEMNNNVSSEVLDETAIITKGMTIKGDISSQGSVDVVGTVVGNIDILGKLNVTGSIQGNSQAAEVYADSAKINGEIISEGTVKIGASSVIIGNITATCAVIAGAVKGDIDVQGPVVLDTSAIVMGNIKSKSVQINNGAVIEGLCSQCYAEVNPINFFDDIK